MRRLALAAALLPSIALAEFIPCPLQKITTDVVTAKPPGWWSTPQGLRLGGTEVMRVGGVPTLLCNYGNPPRPGATIMREAPPGKQCRAVRGGFQCDAGRVPHATPAPSRSENTGPGSSPSVHAEKAPPARSGQGRVDPADLGRDIAERWMGGSDGGYQVKDSVSGRAVETPAPAPVGSVSGQAVETPAPRKTFDPADLGRDIAERWMGGDSGEYRPAGGVSGRAVEQAAAPPAPRLDLSAVMRANESLDVDGNGSPDLLFEAHSKRQLYLQAINGAAMAVTREANAVPGNCAVRGYRTGRRVAANGLKPGMGYCVCMQTNGGRMAAACVERIDPNGSEIEISYAVWSR